MPFTANHSIIYDSGLYHNGVASGVNIELIAPESGIGSIQSILITNTHSSATQSTRIDLYDGTNTFILYNNIDIPAKTSLALTDNISFDSSEFNLRLTTTGSSTCDIIIK